MQRVDNSESPKLDRKTAERNRRIHMKGLCFKLASLIPHHFNTSKNITSQQDQLDHAASYIKELRERVEKLKAKKEEAMRTYNYNNATRAMDTMNANSMTTNLPVFELREIGPAIEVVLIRQVENINFFMYEVISILEEGGAEVVNASFSTHGGKVFYTIHAQVRISRVGVETSRVNQRLQELIS